MKVRNIFGMKENYYFTALIILCLLYALKIRLINGQIVRKVKRKLNKVNFSEYIYATCRFYGDIMRWICIKIVHYCINFSRNYYGWYGSHVVFQLFSCKIKTLYVLYFHCMCFSSNIVVYTYMIKILRQEKKMKNVTKKEKWIDKRDNNYLLLYIFLLCIL